MKRPARDPFRARPNPSLPDEIRRLKDRIFDPSFPIIDCTFEDRRDQLTSEEDSRFFVVEVDSIGRTFLYYLPSGDLRESDGSDSSSGFGDCDDRSNLSDEDWQDSWTESRRSPSSGSVRPEFRDGLSVSPTSSDAPSESTSPRRSLESGEPTLDGSRVIKVDRSLIDLSDRRLKYKTDVCRNYQLGTCPYGDRCIFAHGEEDLRAKVVSLEYRTKVCTEFLRGVCRYGDRCFFAHVPEGSREECRIGDGEGAIAVTAAAMATATATAADR